MNLDGYGGVRFTDSQRNLRHWSLRSPVPRLFFVIGGFEIDRGAPLRFALDSFLETYALA